MLVVPMEPTLRDFLIRTRPTKAAAIASPIPKANCGTEAVIEAEATCW